MSGLPHLNLALLKQISSLMQGPLLMLALRYMPGGSLRSALQDPVMQQRLHWQAR